MKPPRFNYEAPTALRDALARLAELGDEARPLAGGQSLVPAMNLRLANPGCLVDLRRLPELRGIRQLDTGAIVAGAMTRHVDFERSELFKEKLSLVPRVMASVAHPQIRNRGTIGGSLSHADPAAEWPALCLLLGATITVAGAAGTRRLPAAAFSQGVYTTALQTGELVVEVEFPSVPAARRFGFEEVSRRLGDFAIVGAMAWMDLDASQACTAADCVVFAATGKPERIEAAAQLVGRRPGARDFDEVARAARGQVSPLGDHHASAEYRSELVEVLTSRVLAQAANLAGENP